jgi:Tol biopolymer transport system component
VRRRFPLLRRLIALVAAAAMSGVVGAPAQAKVPGVNGQIVFVGDRGRVFDPAIRDSALFTVNPDGTHVQELFAQGSPGLPLWSPDGSEVSIQCCGDGMAAHIIDVDTGSFRELAPPDPTLEVHCDQWSPDGKRLACESFGVTDPSRNGIYTIRASDGRGLTRITSAAGGDDIPGDYSPNGKRLVFVRTDADGQVGLFVVRVDSTGLRQITPPSMIVDSDSGGSWSPSGNRILFVARTSPINRRAIWVVHADGSGLHQLAISPSCGGAFSNRRSISCSSPGWSPDGTKIVFTRVSANGTQSNIYTVNADGSGLSRVTTTGSAIQPDWGPHPLAR